MHSESCDGDRRLLAETDETWRCWHPRELKQRLAPASQPWCVVGGWALDLWHGYQSRDHEDLEFTILRADFDIFRRKLAGFKLYAAGDGKVAYLPDNAPPPADMAQFWCRDVAERCWRVDMMIEPGQPEAWVYKRDPAITRPRADMVAHTPDGVPYLKPAGILLFKAKYRRPKDEADFLHTLPKLEEEERAWLKHALALTHPGHDWIDVL